MKKDIRKRTDRIRKILRTEFPDVKTQLRHKNPFELLIATILSAQCTDRQVNGVTRKLFDTFPGPREMSRAPLAALEKLIYTTGFFRNKAKNINSCSKALCENFDGKVPSNLDDLITLPGVGRKTANVVLGAAFGIPGIVVDTHVARISNRLGLTDNDDPVKIEFDLMEIMPARAWNDFSLHLIYLGRSVCKARKPDCGKCRLIRLCRYANLMA